MTALPCKYCCTMVRENCQNTNSFTVMLVTARLLRRFCALPSASLIPITTSWILIYTPRSEGISELLRSAKTPDLLFFFLPFFCFLDFLNSIYCSFLSCTCFQRIPLVVYLYCLFSAFISAIFLSTWSLPALFGWPVFPSSLRTCGWLCFSLMAFGVDF